MVWPRLVRRWTRSEEDVSGTSISSEHEHRERRIRNARFGNGVTAVSAQDFQRGSFRNQIAVNSRAIAAGFAGARRGAGRADREQLAIQRAPGMRPPRFRAAAAGATSGSSAGCRRRRTTQRTPFTQQQSAVRSAFGGAGRDATRTGSGEADWRAQPVGWLRSGWNGLANRPVSRRGGDANANSGRTAGAARAPAGTVSAAPQTSAPQRFAAPQSGPSSRPCLNSGGYRLSGIGRTVPRPAGGAADHAATPGPGR